MRAKKSKNVSSPSSITKHLGIQSSRYGDGRLTTQSGVTVEVALGQSGAGGDMGNHIVTACLSWSCLRMLLILSQAKVYRMYHMIQFELGTQIPAFLATAE